MPAKKEPVRFAPEVSHIPAWDAKHPLFEQFGSVTWEVQTAHGATRVEIPAVEDAKLTEIIASLAVYFTGTFIKAHRDMGYIIAECVAQAYEELGGTPEAWRAYVESLGIQITVQADNDFVTFLRVLTGTANDPSRRLGKLAQYLDRWVTIRSEGWEGWPCPHIGDGSPGTSPMTAWAKHMDGWSKIARRHALWLRARHCVRCGVPYEVESNGTLCPNCARPSFDPEPLVGDIRVAGFLKIRYESPDSEWAACHAEHPDCDHWEVQRYEDIDDHGAVWVPVGSDLYYSLAAAEAAAAELRSENYSEKISENPATPDELNRPPEGDGDGSPVEKRPGDGSPATGVAANANSNSIKQNPAAERNDPNPPKNPPRADWTGGVTDKKKETVVNLDAANARREAEEAAKKIADLEQKLTETERRAAAAEPR